MHEKIFSFLRRSERIVLFLRARISCLLLTAFICYIPTKCWPSLFISLQFNKKRSRVSLIDKTPQRNVRMFPRRFCRFFFAFRLSTLRTESPSIFLDTSRLIQERSKRLCQQGIFYRSAPFKKSSRSDMSATRAGVTERPPVPSRFWTKTARWLAEEIFLAK